MTNTDYVRRLLAQATQRYGANARATQALRKQLEEDQREKPGKGAALPGGIQKGVPAAISAALEPARKPRNPLARCPDPPKKQKAF